MISWSERGPTVGVMSPGHMGSGLGAALRAGGATVLATLENRSPRSARLAGAAELAIADTMVDLVAACDVVLSVVPPQAAVDAARSLAAAARQAGTTPLVVDLNAVSPTTVRQIAQVLRGADLELVDGSISGPPPSVSPGARVFLSGPRAAEVAALPWTDVEVRELGHRVGDASALKMCTASVYKGTTALLTHAVLTAHHNGVLDAVLAELTTGLGRDPLPSIVVSATKAWRFAPEMEEIAATQQDAGLDPRLFTAITEVYRQLARGGYADKDPEDVDRAADFSTAVERLFPTEQPLLPSLPTPRTSTP